MEERFKCILVPQVLQDFMIILAHDYRWTQQFKKNLQLPEKTILLARHKETDFQTLQEM